MCVTPEKSAGFTTLRASNSGTSFSSPLIVEVMLSITLSLLSESSGSVLGGSTVALTGSNFRNASGLSCRFSMYSPVARQTIVPATYKSETVASCVTPPMPAGLAVVEVSNNGQDFSSGLQSFRFVGEPRVFKVSPRHGSIAGGTSLLVSGSNFVDTGDMFACKVGSQVVAASFVSSTLARCTVPPALNVSAAILDDVAVEISNANFQFSNDGVAFLYQPELQVASIHPKVVSKLPSTGAGSGPVVIRVLGSHFSRRANLCCKVGDLPGVAATYVNSSSVECPVANLPTGSHTFAVSGNCMDFVFSRTRLEVKEPRALVSVHPALGPTHGGTVVTAIVRVQDDSPDVQDAGMDALCRFGTHLSIATRINSTAYSCKSPPRSTTATWAATSSSATASGTVSLQLLYRHSLSPASEMLFSGAATFAYYETPAVATLSPNVGPIAGGSPLEIIGSGFDDSGSRNPCVSFVFGAHATVIVKAEVRSSASLLVKTPVPPSSSGAAALANVAVVEVSNNCQDYTAHGKRFFYDDVVSMLAISPTTVAEKGNVVVTVFGTKFVDSDALACRFGSTAPVKAKFISSTMLSCTAPRHELGGVRVAVTINGKDFSEENVMLTYRAPIIVRELIPTTGPQSGGTRIAILGANFYAGGDLRCAFGDANDKKTAVATVVDETQIECITPFSPRAGFAEVELFSFRDALTKDGVEIEYDNATALTFMYAETAMLTRLVPSFGPRSGGTMMRVVGTGFVDGDGLSCKFGNVVVKAQ